MKSLFAVTCSLYCSVLFAQTPTISKVVDSASFGTRLAPGTLATVSGVNFGTSKSIPVTVGGKACAVLSVSASQLQIQIAVDAPLDSTTMQVGTSAPFNVSLTQYAPVLESADGSGQGNVLAYHAAGTPVTPTAPALPGEGIIIYAIGMGPATPPVPTGAVSPSNPVSFTAAALTASVANEAVPILFSGLAPGEVGIYQVNFLMPADAKTGNQSISLSVGGVASNTLTLPVSNAPFVTQLQNNYSYIPPGFPNYGIAQGAVFIIRGSNLASAETPLQTLYPLPTTLQGVSVAVTVNGTTTHPILYYLTPGQIGAILPSNTPVGTGQITVTTNGQTGPPAPIQVVQSAFGMLTLNGGGTGPAAAFDVNNNYLGFTNAIHPGEYVNLWGSGIGPAAGDETNAQKPVDLAGIPIEVDIGGISANVTYHGRSIYPGLDQIQVIVPANVRPGCWVSVSIRTGTIVSNSATIPVASSGRTCSDPALGITSDLLANPSFTFGTLDLHKDVSGAPPAPSVKDRATAQFQRIAVSQLATTDLQYSSIGGCTFFRAQNQGPASSISGDELDAGGTINFNGPNGQVTANQDSDDNTYTTDLSGTTPPVFIPSTGGTFNANDGAGGVNVGAFAATIAVPAPLVWSNQAAITAVNRSSGVTVNWTGGSPNSYVRISGTSFAASGVFNSIEASFTCSAPVSAGQFTVPSAVLSAVPPTGTGTGAFGTLSVGNYTIGPRFTAPGLDAGFMTSTINYNASVTYQ